MTEAIGCGSPASACSTIHSNERLDRRWSSRHSCTISGCSSTTNPLEPTMRSRPGSGERCLHHCPSSSRASRVRCTHTRPAPEPRRAAPDAVGHRSSAQAVGVVLAELAADPGPLVRGVLDREHDRATGYPLRTGGCGRRDPAPIGSTSGFHGRRSLVEAPQEDVTRAHGHWCWRLRPARGVGSAAARASPHHNPYTDSFRQASACGVLRMLPSAWGASSARGGSLAS